MGAGLASEGKIDPIRENFYGPLERADRISDLLFYLATFLSTSTLVFLKDHNERAANGVSVVFGVVAVASFSLSLAIRLYFMPRAEECRRNDLASNAFGAPLQTEQTDGYYNNGENPSFRRLAGILAENSFFSKSVTQQMFNWERGKTAVSVSLFLLLIFYRDTGIDWVVIAAQFITSEQVVSKCFRLEWLRNRFERTYCETFMLLTLCREETPAFKAKVFVLALNYESAKANAAVLLSGKIFNNLNEKLTHEWETIHKPKLGIR